MGKQLFSFSSALCMKMDFERILSKYKVELVPVISPSLSSLNDRIDQIFIINLRKDVLRRNYMRVLMKKFQLTCTLVIVEEVTRDVVDLVRSVCPTLSKGEIGCLLSHLWCLRKIRDDSLRNALIFEDDVVLHKQFVPMLNRLLDSKEGDGGFDLLLLGACDFSFAKFHERTVKEPGIYRIDPRAKKVYGAHAIYYSQEGATRMYQEKTARISFFDNHYATIFAHFPTSAFICSPNLAITDLSTTNLNHQYPFFSFAESNYYTQCFGPQFSFRNYHYFPMDLLAKTDMIAIEDDDTLNAFINKVLYHYFYNTEKSAAIKKRLTTQFFTLDDLREIRRRPSYQTQTSRRPRSSASNSFADLLPVSSSSSVSLTSSVFI